MLIVLKELPVRQLISIKFLVIEESIAIIICFMEFY
jgi:hypothetical protein